MKIRVRHERWAANAGAGVLASVDALRQAGLAPATKGGRTVAVALDEDGAVLGRAVARCSFEDNYCKRIGRDIAVGRLKKLLREERSS